MEENLKRKKLRVEWADSINAPNTIKWRIAIKVFSAKLIQCGWAWPSSAGVVGDDVASHAHSDVVQPTENWLFSVSNGRGHRWRQQTLFFSVLIRRMCGHRLSTFADRVHQRSTADGSKKKKMVDNRELPDVSLSTPFWRIYPRAPLSIDFRFPSSISLLFVWVVAGVFQTVWLAASFERHFSSHLFDFSYQKKKKDFPCSTLSLFFILFCHFFRTKDTSIFKTHGR